VTITTASTAASPWRIAVIGAVGALAIGMGVTLGSFLLAGRTGALGLAAGYVPASAPFYVEVRLDPGTAQDAALRELLGHFPAIEGLDLARPLYDQLGERIDEAAASAGADATWAGDVAPWFDGHVAMAVTDLSGLAQATGEVPAPSPGDLPVPSVPPTVVLLGVTDRAAAEAALDRVLSSETFTSTDHAGVTIHAASDGTGPGAYAVTADQLIIATDTDAVAAALDAHAAGGDTLRGSADRRGLTESLPSDWLAFVSFDFTQVMADALAMAEAQDPTTAETLRALIEDQPLRGVMAVSAAGDRIVIDGASDAPSGAFAVANADRGLADEVPADAIYFSEGGNIGTALSALIGAIKQAAVQTPDGEDQVRTAEAALGADLEELVSWVGDGAMAIGFDGTEPYGGLVLVPTDMDAAGRRLDQLATFAGLGSLDPSSGVTVSHEDVDGVTLTTIRWEDPNAGSDMLPAPGAISLEYALTEDRVLIGVGETFVRRALALDASDSLASVDRYAAAVDEMGGSTNVGVTWLDLAGLRSALEPLLGATDPQMAAMYETTILPWLEPLDAVVSVSRLDGEIVVQRAALLVD
jgi:hypothetical protein